MGRVDNTDGLGGTVFLAKETPDAARDGVVGDPRTSALGFRPLRREPWRHRLPKFVAHECLDHVLILNEQHLRIVLAEYVAYYNVERPHRSLALETPLPASRSPVPTGTVKSRPVLGGLRHVDHRAA